jgi:hypothetical protein
MNPCARAFEVEDLALGADDRALLDHLDTCASCRASLAAFEEERELFALRASAADLAPPADLAEKLTARATPLTNVRAIFSRARDAGASWRIVHGVLAAFACAAALVFVVGEGGARVFVEQVEPAGSPAMSERQISSYMPAEPVACAVVAKEHRGAEMCADDPRRVCEPMSVAGP